MMITEVELNWQKHYDALITRARSRVIEGYSESHHVLPRCLGGNDSMANLVRLTPEEHFIAHVLLVKMHPGNRDLVWAAELMTVGNLRLQGRSQNKLSGWLKRRVAEIRGSPEVRLAHSERAKNDPRCVDALRRGNEAKTGVPRTAIAKEKLSAAHKTSPAAIEARAAMQGRKRGVPRGEETRKRIGAAQTGKKLSQAHRDAIAAGNRGKPKSAEHNAKVSAALMGKPGTRRGAVLSEETKQKQRDAAIRRYYPDGVVPEKPARDPVRTARAHKAWETKRAKAAQNDEGIPICPTSTT